MSRVCRGGEHGTVTPLLAFLLFVSLLVVALATEVALVHSRFVAVSGIADAAASAGAAQIDVDSLHAGVLAIDPQRAGTEASAYVAVAEPGASVVVEAHSGRVCVEVGVTHRVEILTVVGVGEFAVRASSCALPSSG